VTVKLLIAYASKHGSTQEVAETIAEKVRRGDLEVELRRAADVDDVTPYDGVVLGGSLYFGRWHEDAVRFLSKHRRELSDLPVAVFALGPKTAEPADLADSREQLENALQKTHCVEPSLIAVFGGVIDPAELRFPLSRLPASDARDWSAIESWASEIARDVGGALVPAARAR
jgi:menaquinone-dependent protoporphyrinogen oxidase